MKLNPKQSLIQPLISEIVEKSDRKRFEIVGNKIRALYGHTIPVKSKLQEDKIIEVLYHGTTLYAASRILKAGLKPMKRRWVHLSPTVEIAKEVGLRRTKNPVILEIDAEGARKNGLRFCKATDKVYVCDAILSRYVKVAEQSKVS